MLNHQRTKAVEAKIFLEKADEFVPGELLQFRQGKGRTTNIICGHFHFENNNAHPILKNLPPLLHIKKEENSHSPWLSTMLDFVDFESKLPSPGTRTLIKKLTEVIFIQAIRVYLEKNSQNSSILNLVSDQYISRSIDAIHHHPEKKWTIDELAATAGLSRTVYSKRFKQISGMTPHNYLTHWRMEIACELLKNTDKTTAEIAEAIGYQTNEHFQKAFKKQNGITPSRFRKNTNTKNP
jgi:AraC-like DNA-binding protein